MLCSMVELFLVDSCLSSVCCLFVSFLLSLGYCICVIVVCLLSVCCYVLSHYDTGLYWSLYLSNVCAAI